MALYFVIFALIASFTFSRAGWQRKLLVVGGVLLFLIAALRGPDIDRDYRGYLEYYQAVVSDDFKNVEPAFIVVVTTVDGVFGHSIMLFVIFAFLGVFIKLYAIDKLTPYKNLALLFYYVYFFLLHEMTQIRVGVASALLLLCIQPIKQRNAWLFLLWAGLAILFHYSALVILPLYFVGAGGRDLRRYAFLLPIAAVMYSINFTWIPTLDLLPIGLIKLKLTSYAVNDSVVPTNVFNALFLLRCCMAYLLLWLAHDLTKKSNCFPVLLKIYFISLFVYIAIARIPAVGSRVSELLNIVEVVLFPTLLLGTRQRLVVHWLLVILSLAYLVYFLLFAHLIQPYF
jgi:hypothetical protein